MPNQDPSDYVPTWTEWPDTTEHWPIYKLGEDAQQWKNGREGGAWLAGVVCSIPEKCALVEVQDEWIAGALVALMEGGCCVGPYSRRKESTTFEVWAAHLLWGPERTPGFVYPGAAIPHPGGVVIH